MTNQDDGESIAQQAETVMETVSMVDDIIETAETQLAQDEDPPEGAERTLLQLRVTRETLKHLAISMTMASQAEEALAEMPEDDDNPIGFA